jgi:hypothetical protein
LVVGAHRAWQMNQCSEQTSDNLDFWFFLSRKRTLKNNQAKKFMAVSQNNKAAKVI